MTMTEQGQRHVLAALIDARVAGLPCTPEAAVLADALIAALRPLAVTVAALCRAVERPVP